MFSAKDLEGHFANSQDYIAVLWCSCTVYPPGLPLWITLVFGGPICAGRGPIGQSNPGSCPTFDINFPFQTELKQSFSLPLLPLFRAARKCRVAKQSICVPFVNEREQMMVHHHS